MRVHGAGIAKHALPPSATQAIIGGPSTGQGQGQWSPTMFIPHCLSSFSLVRRLLRKTH